MSAAVQIPTMWSTGLAGAAWEIETWRSEEKDRGRPKAAKAAKAVDAESGVRETPACLAFYRRHTESLLRRYLYASTQVGRTPSLLSEPVGRGWASSRPIRTFEDAIIFVLDVEKCLSQLDWIDQQVLSRVILQEYTQAEAAGMLGMCVRTISSRLAKAVDRLTELLLDAGLLILPK